MREQAAADSGHTLAGHGSDVPESTRHVVQVEGEAVTTAPAANRGPAMTALLFRPDGDASPVALDNLPALIAVDANFVWVDLSAYSADDLRAVAALLGLHRRAVRAALSPWHRPRLDVYGDRFFASVTVARLDSQLFQVHAGELDLFMGNNFLVSAHKQALPFGETVLARARQSPELVQLDTAFMLYVILDELLAYYDDLTEHLQGEIAAMELRALRDTSETFLENLLHFKRYAFALSQLANQHRDLFAAFLRPDFPFIVGDEVTEYFEDLDDHLTRLLDTLLTVNNAVNGAFEIYVSHVSFRTNQVMKVLTMVSTVLLPVTIIVGIFGTSIQGLPLYQPFGFLVMLLAIATVSATILYLYHRRGWL